MKEEDIHEEIDSQENDEEEEEEVTIENVIETLDNNDMILEKAGVQPFSVVYLTRMKNMKPTEKALLHDQNLDLSIRKVSRKKIKERISKLAMYY